MVDYLFILPCSKSSRITATATIAQNKQQRHAQANRQPHNQRRRVRAGPATLATVRFASAGVAGDTITSGEGEEARADGRGGGEDGEEEEEEVASLRCEGS